MQNKQKGIEIFVSENLRLIIYLIMIVFGLLVGYSSEAGGQGNISPGAVVFACLLIFPGSIGIFYELYKKIKGKSINFK
jgi:hypothetical protein